LHLHHGRNPLKTDQLDIDNRVRITERSLHGRASVQLELVDYLLAIRFLVGHIHRSIRREDHLWRYRNHLQLILGGSVELKFGGVQSVIHGTVDVVRTVLKPPAGLVVLPTSIQFNWVPFDNSRHQRLSFPRDVEVIPVSGDFVFIDEIPPIAEAIQPGKCHVQIIDKAFPRRYVARKGGTQG
jgi:hypothetical protein